MQLYVCSPSRLTVRFIRHALLDDEGAVQLGTTSSLSRIPFRASLIYFFTSRFVAVVLIDVCKYILLQNQHCPNLIQDRVDPADRHEVVIVEAERIAIIETRRGFPVPFDTASWLCVTKIFHRSQVSE